MPAPHLCVAASQRAARPLSPAFSTTLALLPANAWAARAQRLCSAVSKPRRNALRLGSPSAEWGSVMHLQRSWRTLVRCLGTFGREVPTVRPAILLTISSTYDGREGITPEQHNTLHLNYSSSSSTNVIAEISHHVSLSIPFIPNDSEHVNCI